MMFATEVTHHNSTGEGRGQKSTTGRVPRKCIRGLQQNSPAMIVQGRAEVSSPLGSPEVCPMLATEITHHNFTGGGG